jgi:hypothetical protein
MCDTLARFALQVKETHMRLARKLMLLATMAIAAMALAAPSAFGQNDVEVTNEATGAHCGTLATTPCSAHGVSTGSVTLTAHVFGAESVQTVCNNEFTLQTDEDGNGRLINQNLSGASCTRQPCRDADNNVLPWNGTGAETAVGVLRLTVNFCVEPIGGGSDTTCELEVPIKHSGGHAYEFGTKDAKGNPVEIACHGTAGFRGEVTGHWVSEGTTSGLEIKHLTPGVHP